MSYNSNIPLGTDPILQSQAQIRANFQSINNVFSNNHFPLNGDPEFQGMHVVLTMRPQNVTDPSTDATHVAFYNKLVSTIPQLFFRPNSNQTPIQLTYQSINTSKTSPQQYSFVAGPFVVYGGKIHNPTNGQTVTLTPTTTLLYVGLTSANVVFKGANVLAAIPTSISGSSFNISYSGTAASVITSLDVYYLAIGM